MINACMRLEMIHLKGLERTVVRQGCEYYLFSTAKVENFIVLKPLVRVLKRVLCYQWDKISLRLNTALISPKSLKERTPPTPKASCFQITEYRNKVQIFFRNSKLSSKVKFITRHAKKALMYNALWKDKLFVQNLLRNNMDNWT